MGELYIEFSSQGTKALSQGDEGGGEGEAWRAAATVALRMGDGEGAHQLKYMLVVVSLWAAEPQGGKGRRLALVAVAVAGETPPLNLEACG